MISKGTILPKISTILLFPRKGGNTIQQSFYEIVQFVQPAFPVIFHLDEITPEHEVMMHWQDNLELLFFIEGQAQVRVDTQAIEAGAGDLTVVNYNRLHSVAAMTPVCRYYCLIIGRSFFERLGLSAEEISFAPLVRDPEMGSRFQGIVGEMGEKKPLYREAAAAGIESLLIALYRDHQANVPFKRSSGDKRLDMVKKAIHFIGGHYAETLTVDRISAEIGFSKYYFCRGFKEITGQTVVNYLNDTRCSAAKRLLEEGHTVAESAERSGFSSPSYFARTYKKYMGTPPSAQKNVGKKR